MKIRDKNEVMKSLIEDLNREGYGNNVNLWKSLAKRLNRPTRNYPEVSLYKLEKYANPKKKIIVPGKVLAIGELRKSLTVAAIGFSGQAKEKIEKGGGKCITISDLVKSNPDGKGVKIIE